MDECMEKLNPVVEKPVNLCKNKRNDTNHLKSFGKKLIYHKPLMHLLDATLSMFVIGPLTVTYWRSTWVLMDLHSRIFPFWPTLIFSATLLIFFSLIRETGIDIVNWYRESKESNFYTKLTLRVYTYSFSWVSIMNWRAMWGVLDTYLNLAYTENFVVIYSDSIFILFIITGMCFFILTLIKCIRNNIAAPFVVALDREEITFNFPTRFRVQVNTFSLFIISLNMRVGFFDFF